MPAQQGSISTNWPGRVCFELNPTKQSRPDQLNHTGPIDIQPNQPDTARANLPMFGITGLDNAPRASGKQRRPGALNGRLRARDRQCVSSAV